MACDGIQASIALAVTILATLKHMRWRQPRWHRIAGISADDAACGKAMLCFIRCATSRACEPIGAGVLLLFEEAPIGRNHPGNPTCGLWDMKTLKAALYRAEMRILLHGPAICLAETAKYHDVVVNPFRTLR